MASGNSSDMQQAFQRFMLTTNSSKGTKKNKKKKQAKQTPPPTPPIPSPSRQSRSPSKSPSKNKQHLTVIKAFRGILVREWLPVDDNLHQLVQSIASLRQQIWYASGSAADAAADKSNTSNRWRTCGYRGSSRRTCDRRLHTSDVQLALTHALLQHERMLAGLRKLIQALGQAQQAMVRRLDELLILYCTGNTVPGAQVFMALQMEECRELYQATANELLRKQIMADQILESSSDACLQLGRNCEADPAASRSQQPRTIARKVATEWPRQTNPKSHLQDWEPRLQEIQSAF